MKAKTAVLIFLLTAATQAQIPVNKILTFIDLQTLIDTEGYQLKNAFNTTSNKAVTKSEVIQALWLDESGAIGALPANQLISKQYLVKQNLTQKAIFRAAYYDNVHDQASKGTVSIPMLHNGAYDLPVKGNTVYNQNGSPFVGVNYFYTVQRYPSPGNDEVNIQVDNNGLVTWTGWTVDRTTAPFNLTATNIGIGSFTLNWQANSSYYNQYFTVDMDGVQQTAIEATGQGSYQYAVTGISDATWTVRVFAKNGLTGSPTLYTKSASIFVDVLPYLTTIYIRDSQSGNTCQVANTNFIPVFKITSADVAVGDYIYTNATGTTALNGQGRWWYSEGETRQYRIGSNGQVQAIANCN